MLGNDLLSHRVTPTVPSALEGLTSVFGKGTGVSPPPWPPNDGIIPSSAPTIRTTSCGALSTSAAVNLRSRTPARRSAFWRRLSCARVDLWPPDHPTQQPSAA